MNDSFATTFLIHHEHGTSRGFSTVPLKDKTPFDATCNQPLKGWLTPRFYPVEYWEPPITGIGLLLGNFGDRTLVDIDLDDEISSANFARMPPTYMWGRGKKIRHLLYSIEGKIASRQIRDPHTGGILFEVRSSGAQTMMPPSFHPNGQFVEFYAIERGSISSAYRENQPPPSRFSAGEFTSIANKFAVHLLEKRYKTCMTEQVRELIDELSGAPVKPSVIAPVSPKALVLSADARFTRARKYLETMNAAVSGQNGHANLFRAAVALIRGFILPESEALDLLWREYNPRCSPQWSLREIERKVREATTSSTKPYGFLFDRGVSQ